MLPGSKVQAGADAMNNAVQNDLQLKQLSAGIKAAAAKGDTKAVAEYTAAFRKREAEIRKRGYAKGGVVSGGRGSTTVAPGDDLQPVTSGGTTVRSGTGTTVKSRSFSAPPRAPAVDDTPIVKPMAQDAPITGAPLDGPVVKPMAAAPDDNETPLPDPAEVQRVLRLDPIEVTGKMGDDGKPDVGSLSQPDIATPLKKALKRPPVRTSY
jgi:hypothetical protein